VTEASLKGDLVEKLRKKQPTWVIFRHEDKSTSGIPDISITGRGNTIWIEVKFANPDYKSTGIQELTMLRLASQGKAFYLIYNKPKDMAMLVPPRLFHVPEQHYGMISEGLDHDWVIEMIENLL
jgi:hypothetical protein